MGGTGSTGVMIAQVNIERMKFATEVVATVVQSIAHRSSEMTCPDQLQIQLKAYIMQTHTIQTFS